MKQKTLRIYGTFYYGWNTNVLHTHTSFLLWLLSHEKILTPEELWLWAALERPMSWFVKTWFILEIKFYADYYWLSTFYDPSQGRLNPLKTHCMISELAFYGSMAKVGWSFLVTIFRGLTHGSTLHDEELQNTFFGKQALYYVTDGGINHNLEVTV